VRYAGVGSAMEMLRAATTSAQRDEACTLLAKSAENSCNQKTEAGRKSFLELKVANRKALVNAIEVYDNAPNLIDMREEIEGQLVFSAPDHVQMIADHLEGWWFSVVAESLIHEDKPSIPVQYIVRKVYEIAGHIQRGELPVLDSISTETQEYSAEDEDRVFVKQMRLINVSDNAVQRGAGDYYRALAQRSQWARENLLLDGEATIFDWKLVDQWERRYEQEMDLNAPTNDGEKEIVGKNIFYWAQESQIPFRNVVEAWITAGSFHSLADRLQVGWHPDFKSKIDIEGDNK